MPNQDQPQELSPAQEAALGALLTEPSQENPTPEARPPKELWPDAPSRDEIRRAAEAEEAAVVQAKNFDVLQREREAIFAAQRQNLSEKAPHVQKGDAPRKAYDDGTVRVHVDNDGAIIYERQSEDAPLPPPVSAPVPAEPAVNETPHMRDKREAEMAAGAARVQAHEEAIRNRPPPSRQELAARRRDQVAEGRSVPVVRPGAPLSALLEGNVRQDANSRR